MGTTITINHITYTHDQIANEIIGSKSEFEKTTIAFCKDWLKGRQEFNIQTSGSTGSPKKISIARNQMIESAKRTVKSLELKKGWTSLVCLDTKYIAGQMMLVRSFVNEMNIYAIEPKQNPLEEIPTSEELNFAALVPYQLQALLESQSQRLSTFNAIIIGGTPINTKLKQKLQSLNCDIYATYGMTETMSHIALQKLNGDDAQSHFHTFHGIEVSKDSRNCLVAKVDFLDAVIKTNDIIDLHNSREFTWLGRWDNIINSGGHKVVPEKLENLISEKLSDKNIKSRFFVTSLPESKLGEQVVLIIEGDKSAHAITLINEILGSTLPKYEIPKSIHFVEAFKETASGKVDRQETKKLIPL